MSVTKCSAVHRFLSITLLGAVLWAPRTEAATASPVMGEIDSITVTHPGDHWSGGRIVVGGQVVILPRNLLIDLPANRVTLAQLFAEAPAACLAAGQSGLAKGDTCNTSGTGGFVNIAANRTNAGNIIAGDVFIEKAAEAIAGTVTYIDHADGYFRLNGAPGDAATGVMVRLNDPDSRHTIQQGLGCAAGSSNCSADPRFTLDGDNYTNTFSTGYPLCIPSTVARPFPGLPAGTGVAALPAGTAHAAANGTGDVLCPTANRGSDPVTDSRRFAPLQVGDSITVEGNFEVVNGVRFLSAHTSMVGRALATKAAADQPDYLFLDEVEIDAGGFQNQRARTLIIGYATRAPTDIVIWSIHYDPARNEQHLFPLASSIGCDNAAGAGTCTNQGLVGAGANIFKIRHDVDFLAGAKPKVNPCAHLAADPRLAALNVCPSGAVAELNTKEMFAILSPIPHEIQARTGHSLANPGQITIDVNGAAATNGQYLFPFGVGLGGIAFPEMNEINLDNLASPFIFTGLPWTLDRRLSPAGCIDTDGDGVVDCESTPQPLDPYPFEDLDPRTQASFPFGLYNDPNYTASPLAVPANRILSFIDPVLGKFNGGSTVLAWPPANPGLISIAPTPLIGMVCSASLPGNSAPLANADAAITLAGTAVTIPVLANDSDPDNNPLSITAITQGASGGTVVNNGSSVTFTPAAGFTGVDTFTVTISDGAGGTATSPVSVTVNSTSNLPPVARPDTATTTSGTPVVISVLANDSDPDGGALSVISVTASGAGLVVNDGLSVTYTPSPLFAGIDIFGYTVADGQGGTASSTVTVTVGAQELLSVALAQLRTGTQEWRVNGTTTVPGASITIDFGGGVTRTVGADALGAFTFREKPSAIPQSASINVSSSGGGTLTGVPVLVRR